MCCVGISGRFPPSVYGIFQILKSLEFCFCSPPKRNYSSFVFLVANRMTGGCSLTHMQIPGRVAPCNSCSPQGCWTSPPWCRCLRFRESRSGCRKSGCTDSRRDRLWDFSRHPIGSMMFLFAIVCTQGAKRGKTGGNGHRRGGGGVVIIHKLMGLLDVWAILFLWFS